MLLVNCLTQTLLRSKIQVQYRQRTGWGGAFNRANPIGKDSSQTAGTPLRGNTTMQSRLPNILFILADDLGWTDLGCMGSTYYETPHIDALAARGVRFTDAYAAAPVCSATRASILTGWSPARQHLVDVTPHLRDANYAPGYADYANWDAPPEYCPREPHRRLVLAKQLGQIQPGRVTFASRLKEKGYATGYFGKWHLGPDEDKYPEAFGFDCNVGGNHFGWPPSYFPPYHNNRLPDGGPTEYLADRLTDEAITFIETSADAGRPFLCYLPHYSVHGPFQSKQDYVDHFTPLRNEQNPHNNPIYAGMIKSLDDSVGRLMKILTRRGLLENTLVIFFSDNGGVAYPAGSTNFASHWGGYPTLTSVAPLRGYKATLYEGGVRVPLIVSWPGAMADGKVCRTPVISDDFFPTLLDLAGIDPGRHPLDGLSLRPLFEGREQLGRDHLSFYFPWASWLEGFGLEDYLTPSASIRRGDDKLVKLFEGGCRLYNLADDIGERRDLASDEPQRVQELEALLMKDLACRNAHLPLPNPDYEQATWDRHLHELRHRLKLE
jgi:arylsulfatase A-like enzyme